MADEFLDFHDRIGVFFADVADGLTAGAGPGGPADAVDVVLRVLGQVVVDHMADRGNVQAAGGDIGGHQDPYLPCLELLEELFPFLLGDVPGEGSAFDVVGQQRIGHVFSGMAGVDKDEHPVGVDLFQLVDQERQLFLVAGVVAGFHHLVRNHLVAVNLDFHRVVHVLIGQFHDAIGQGGGKEQVQPLVRGRHPAQQVPDIPDEPEVEHAVRLVQDGNIGMLEGEQVLTIEVDQASRGADQDIVVARKHVFLLLVAGAAVHQSDGQFREPVEQQGIPVYLDRQLPRGRKYQCPGFALLVSGQRFPGQQPVAAGQQERDGLAGSGLGLACHVRAVQGVGKRLRLDRRAVFKSCFLHPAKQAVVQWKGGELMICKMGFCHGGDRSLPGGAGD